MTPEFKAKWLEALRSGKYQQAKGALRDRSGAMCCLGVACDLLDSAQWNAEPAPGGFGWNGCEPTHCGAIAYAIGISIPDAQSLAVRNDGTDGFQPHSFAQIADIIESEIDAND